MSDYTSTDLYKSLLSQRTTLLERIEGTRGSEMKWHEHWKTELAAVQRALWSLAGDYPTRASNQALAEEVIAKATKLNATIDAMTAQINRETSDAWRPL